MRRDISSTRRLQHRIPVLSSGCLVGEPHGVLPDESKIPSVFVLKCDLCGSYLVSKHGRRKSRFRCEVCGSTFSLNVPLPHHYGQSKRLSDLAKARIAADVVIGVPKRKVAETYRVSERTVRRIVKKFRTERFAYVWRLDYDNLPHLREEVEKRGRLWQGWGWEDLRRGPRAYLEAAKRENPNLEPRSILRRYEILKIMLVIKEGDYVLVPKYAGEHTFMMAEVVRGYDYDPDDPYGHYVEIKNVKVFRMAFEDPQEAYENHRPEVQRIGEILRVSRSFHYAISVVGGGHGRLLRTIYKLVEG